MCNKTDKCKGEVFKNHYNVSVFDIFCRKFNKAMEVLYNTNRKFNLIDIY